MSEDLGGGAKQRGLPPFSDEVLENVLENVLQFLKSRRDRSAVSLVCRSWYRAEAQTRADVFIGNCYAVAPSRVVVRFPHARSVVLKGKPRFADFGLVPQGWGARFSPWAFAFASSYSNLEKLYLKRITIADADLALLSRSLPAFRELSLFCCDGFGTAGLAAIAANCRLLQVFDLIENDVEDDEDDEAIDWISTFPSTHTNLQSLVFDCVRCAVNFDALEALVARSPYLGRLRVNHHITADQILRLMARAPNLTDLGTGSFRPAAAVQAEEAVGDPQFAATFLPAFASASQSLVCLSGFRELSPSLLPALLPACSNLTSLNLSYAEISPEQFRPVISCCHKLQTLWVMDLIRDEGLELVAATCVDLRELRVFPFDPSEDSEASVSDVGLLAIANGCPKLRSILYFCQRMTNAAVISMSRSCPDLVVFRLCIMGRHLPDYLTGEPMDDGFGAIVMNCKKLTRLSVSGLLTDKAFMYIGKYGKLVRTISVAFAGDSDQGLSYVLEGCTKLQKLEIRDSPFGDAALLSGIHHYYNMRFLWMSTCRLSLRGCRVVARRLPQLVVEVIRERSEGEDLESIGTLYMYRSLAGPRSDTPPFVKIL